jgi:DNA-binding response OmpR family regulator
MVVSMPPQFLLIADAKDEYGTQVLRETLTELGPVQIATEGGLDASLAERFCDVVIVDAAAVERAATIVRRIREKSPSSKVVVITASPHWRVARDVFRAGAVDYMRKPWHREEILNSFRSVVG